MGNEDDAAIVHELAFDAIEAGHETVGDYVDHLESLSDADRRAVLDKARTGAGLEPTGVIEQPRSDAVFERELDRLQPPAPPKWSPLQRCAVCGTYPMDESGWKRVSVERWHCPVHVHLAQPGDMEPHQPAYTGRFTPGGRPIPTEREKARLAKWTEERRAEQKRERRKRDQYRRREADVIDAGQAALRG